MDRNFSGSAQARPGDRRGAPRSKGDFRRTCTILRQFLEQRKLASPEEIAGAWPPSAGRAALWEWAYCWAQYCRFMEREERPARPGANKTEAAARIITRAPVHIRLAGREVAVTFRGLVALNRLARHDLARRDLDRRLTRLSELAVEIERRRHAGSIRPAAAKRRTAWLRRIHSELHEALLHHTQVVLANALTPDGRDVLPEEAATWLETNAAWWRRILPQEEPLLFWALFEAGPGRLSSLGPPPKDEEPSGRAWREDVGYWSLWSWFFREHGLDPAALGIDVAQFEALMRFGTPYFPPPEREKGKVH